MTPKQIKELTTWMRENGAMQFSYGDGGSLTVVFAPKAIGIPGKPAPAPVSETLQTEDLADGDEMLMPQGDDPIYDHGIS